MRDTRALKRAWNWHFVWSIVCLWLRHLRFESLLRVYNAIKPVTSFCQVFKVEICKANTTVTWQVDIICQHLGTFVFRGFFMPEYCFLRRYSGTFSLPQNLARAFERHRSNQNRNTNWNEQNSERIQKIIFITVDFIKARVYNQKK